MAPKPVVKASPGKLPMEFISTWNNYTEDDESRLRSWCESNTVYSVVGREVGASGTPHLQGFHQCRKQLRFAPFHTLFPAVHVAKVTVNNGAEKYCKKDGDIAFECGTLKQKRPGQRNDLAEIAKLCTSGMSLGEVAAECPEAILRFPTGCQRLISLTEKPRDRSTPKVCICLWGPSEVHKTRRIFDHCDSLGVEPYVWENGAPTWWDGYNQHKHVIMDEFRSQLPMSTLLRLTDRYPMRVQFKGGSCQFVADYIYFTSSKHPREWYQDLPDDKVHQLIRRFRNIVHVQSCEQLVSFD